MFRIIAMSLAAFALAGAFSPADAQRAPDGTLVTIATRDVQLSQDRETIDVRQARGAFRAVRIGAKDPIKISRVQVVYADGSVHDENRPISLGSGERTREINPTLKGRLIDKINIDYQRSKNSKGTATLVIFGLQTSDDATAQRSSGSLQTSATSSDAKKGGPGGTGADVLFGARHVGFKNDRDTIRIGREIGKFDRIRLRVLDNDIFINHVKVVYASGEPDTFSVNSPVKKNARTGWFDLKGDRFIQEIQLDYRSRQNFAGQARVEVFGDYAKGWLKPDGEGRKYNKGWVLLGSQSAGFIGFANVLIPIGRNAGGFTKFQVTVQDRAITLNELRITYGNGETDIIPVRNRIDAGSTYGPIDLKSGAGPVTEIRAKYRSRFFDKNASGRNLALVQIWGQH